MKEFQVPPLDFVAGSEVNVAAVATLSCFRPCHHFHRHCNRLRCLYHKSVMENVNSFHFSLYLFFSYDGLPQVN